MLTGVSGESPNLVMGAEMAREMGLKVVTFVAEKKQTHCQSLILIFEQSCL